jgi:hypothetical protein
MSDRSIRVGLDDASSEDSIVAYCSAANWIS